MRLMFLNVFLLETGFLRRAKKLPIVTMRKVPTVCLMKGEFKVL
jgi:hypothetical protein